MPLHAVLAIVIALQSTAPQQRDTRTWYQAYADAQRNIQQQNWQAAIADIQATSRLGAPRPGRNVLFYGDVYRDFNPDYYLGLAYVGLKRFADADSAFERVKQAQLITARDSLFAQFTSQAGVAKEGAQAQVRPASPVPPASASSVPPAGLSAPGNVGQKAPNTQTLAGANPPPFSPMPTQSAAVTRPQTAPSTALDPKPAAALPRPNPVTNVPTQARPTTAVRPPVPPPAAQTPAPSAAAPLDERTGVLQFFSGDYESAAASLALVANSAGASPRAYFYLACSRAALVLTGKAPRSAIDDARAQLLLARDTGQFAADKRLISPRIRLELGMQP